MKLTVEIKSSFAQNVIASLVAAALTAGAAKLLNILSALA